LRGVGLTSGSRNLTQTILSPIQKAASDIFGPVGRFMSDVKNFGKTKAELADLKAANAKLKEEAVLSADVKGQLAQLKNVLDLSRQRKF
jgi:cell shape-determining protein MreC